MEEILNLPYSSIADALQYQSEIRPDKIGILYPDPQTNSTEYASLTYKQFNNITNYLAEKIGNYFSSEETITCAILAVGGIEYLLSQYALLKIENVIMFPISPRNSQSAIEHLLKETKTKILLTTSQYLSMINQDNYQLQILLLDSELFQIEELLKYKDIEYSIKQIKNNKEELNKVVVILHSSGSTAHPKAIRLTNRYFLLGFTLYSSINKHFWEENDVTLSWGTLFHLLSFTGTVRSIVMGCTYALPLCVTFPPSPDELLRNIQVNNGITTLITVPSLLEQLVRELISEKNQHIGLKPLQKLKFVMYGGAGCPEELCKTLVDNDVRLISIYGATETGGILIKNYNPYDKRWKYMEIPQVRKEYLRIETPPNAQNTNEKILIHLPSDPYLAENISNSPDGCYTVGDILLEDPPNSGEYLILGRQDDTLVHITGEKTNPIPMEDTIRRSPFVQQVAIIGHNQFCTAALIQLNIQQTSNLNSNEIEDIIWNSVEQANKDAPSHSRLVKQLVHILPINYILPITDKGNLMRQKVNQQYSTLINQIYDQFFNQQYQQKQIKWTKESIRKYLQDQLKSIVENLNDCSRSIFDYGFNSLQVVQLRNLICENICQIPKNFLYENSSIDQMTEQLIQLIQSDYISNEDPFHYQLTEQIIDKYIQLIKQNPIQSIQQNIKSERVFLITGANGSLGSFVIRDLLKQPIKRIYCLLRGENTKQRLRESFQQRKLDINSLLDQRLVILSESMNLSDEYLGQNNEIYQELQNEVTDIIHSAWKMNFNQTIKDFESDSILGVFNLLKFSSFNQKQFHFISSISSAASGILSHIKEEPLPRNPEIALPQGYGQSKYASEHLCWTARSLWNVPINIYRVGQVSGDTENGIWNTTEMAAMMIYAGAGQLHKMPNIGQDINWIPVDICSASLIDLALKSSFDISTSVDEHVYHLINPNITKYQEYILSLQQAGLIFDIVSPKEFVDAILTTNDLSNPLIKLSSFFEQIYLNKSNFTIFQTEKTVKKCDILKNCPKIDSNLIKLYLNYWKKCQLFNQIS